MTTHESKIVAIEGGDGRYQAVASAQVRFIRGQFALVLTPVEPEPSAVDGP
jgi:hypothetical protein